ncbi:hypothetical protein NXF25_004895 [Crotalus adamanteus]|uniref:Gypsy retrotransposon integrase-like protein 1 n=1 Tax=Crotalus adamanteus TaxID=8729 RepID=A0AAW1BW89_CROAD
MPQYHSKREEVIQAVIPLSQHEIARSAIHNPQGSELHAIRTALLTDKWANKHPGWLTNRDGVAWKGDKMYVPESLRTSVLRRCHDAKQAGHFGFLKTLHLLRRQFWWPRLKVDVEQYVRGCHVCASAKPRIGKPMGLLQTVSNPSRPWEEIAMDFIVELPENRGYNVIWTVIDLFSKQAHFIPCKGLPSARRLSRLFIQHIYRLHGTPKRIISDRGVQFTARFWREFVHLLGSSQALSSAYHPSTNGVAERANAMVERYLRSYVSFQQTDWVDLLPFAEVAYNNTVHSSTGYTPFKIVFGVEFNPIPEWSPEVDRGQTPQTWYSRVTELWERVKAARWKAEAAVKVQADKKRAEHKPFKVGDWMYLATKYLRLQVPCKKLGPKYVGPFQVTKVINPVTVKLRLPASLGRVHPVFHSSLLKPAHRSPYTDGAPGPISGSHYEVQEVLDSRRRYGKVQYLLRWKGYPLSDATWVEEGDINAPRLIRAFHRKCPGKPGRNGCHVVYSNPILSFPGRNMVEGAACQALKACHTQGDRGADGSPPSPEAAEQHTTPPHRRTGHTHVPNMPPRSEVPAPTSKTQLTSPGPPENHVLLARTGFPEPQLIPASRVAAGVAMPEKNFVPSHTDLEWTWDGGDLPIWGDARQREFGGGRLMRGPEAREEGCEGGIPSVKGRAQGKGGALIQYDRMLVWDWGRGYRVGRTIIMRREETTPSADFASHLK